MSMTSRAQVLCACPCSMVADALAIVKRMLVAGANPNAMNLQVKTVSPQFPGGHSGGGGGGGGGGDGRGVVQGRVLHLW